MPCLADIEKIDYNITNGKRAPLKALSILVFGDTEQRLNRNKLKKFEGFKFEKDSDEYAAKAVDIKNKLTLADLVSVCHVLDINYGGTDDDVIERILHFLGHIEANHDGDDDDDEEEEDVDEEDGNAAEQVKNSTNDARIETTTTTTARKNHENRDDVTRDFVGAKSDDENAEMISTIHFGEEAEKNSEYEGKKHDFTSFSVSFRDLEGSIKRFNGKDGYPINKWIEDFEEIADITGWNDLQKLIFAKKSLDDLAKLLIQSERGITSWYKLKTTLKREFEEQVNSADVHKLLMTRIKRAEETVQEYTLVMREIASRAHIDPEIVIQYVIDGIHDEVGNKLVLYGAKTFEDFKEKTKLYEIIKKKMTTEVKHDKKTNYTRDQSKNAQKYTETKDDKSMLRCFGCGVKGHRSQNCPSKQKGLKCFNCNEFGHISRRCPNNNTVRNNPAVNNISVNPAGNQIVIQINEQKLFALIDTGADVSVMREDVHEKIGAPNLSNENVKLNGIGINTVDTKGSFEAMVQIDGDEYPLLFHVVPKSTMKYEGIIGNNILDLADIEVTKEKAYVKKKEENNSLMKINIENQSRSVDLSHLKPNRRAQIEELINEYNPTAIKTTPIETKIIMKSEEPVRQAPRRLSPSELDEVNRQIDDLLKKNIIRPSTSEYSSPLVLVKKKDGNTRMCIDYRLLNAKVLRDQYPLPLIEDQLDKLQGSCFFSTLDLKNGFYHVPVAPDSYKYTAFVTPTGHFEFLKTPFGFCNSPASFQRYIHYIFRNLIVQKIVAVYLDDVVILAETEEEAITRLKLVLDVAKDYGLEINWGKCQFLHTKITYLGYEVEDGKIKPSQEKLKAVENYPEPRDVREVQQFLGLTGYFRKFIQNYSIIAKPLSDLLRKNTKMIFQEEQRNAFRALKASLSQQPVLKLYKHGLETELHTDASKYGLAAILMQKDEEDHQFHPVFYHSKKTTPPEQNYSSYELEVLAIVSSLKKFRIYLLGINFKIITDCAAFKATMNKKDISPRIARWALQLEDYQYEIHHRPGKKLKHVDALSRNPVLIIEADGLIPRIRKAQDDDKTLQEMRKRLEKTNDPIYQERNGLLYKYQDGTHLLMIPKNLEMEVIRKAHEIGHFNVTKTKDILQKDYWIPKLENKIKYVMENCVPCILASAKTGKKEGFLNPINKSGGPLHTFHLDHVGPLPSSNKKYQHVLVITDGFTKYTWIFPTKTTNTEEVLQKLKIVQETFGNPARIITDRGTAFTSNDFKQYCTEQQITHLLIATGVPRGNGQVERMNQIIIGVLTKLSIDEPREWYKNVKKVQTALNSTYQRAINTTPFELMIGTKMRNNNDLKLYEMIEEESRAQFGEEREQLRIQAKEQISKIQEENKTYFNKKRKEARKYEIGELVAIKRTQFGSGLKVYSKFLGPYRVTQVQPHDRYHVERAEVGDGPKKTISCADMMKPWRQTSDEIPTDDESQEESQLETEEESSEADDLQDGRVVGHLTPPTDIPTNYDGRVTRSRRNTRVF